MPKKRSPELVRDYLFSEFDRPELTHGSRLPPIRDIAAHLKVSARTVHLAIQELAHAGLVRTVHGSGTFLVRHRDSKRDRLTIAVGMVAPGSRLDDPWHHGIYGGMLSAALRASIPISFLPACRDSRLDEDVGESLLAQRDKADGLILFPFNELTDLYEQVRSTYEKEGKPVVTVNPPAETSTTNFVSPDYLGASHQLGNVWKETKRGQVVLLLGAPLKVSTSARLRWAGLMNALGVGLGSTIECRAIQTTQGRGPGEDMTYRIIRSELAKGLQADAIYAVSDPIALGAFRAVREAGLRVPEDVSVVGGSGIDLTGTACPQLTRTWQPLATMGEKLVEMLVQRIELGPPGHNSVHGIYLPTPFVGGATTRPEENDLLGIGAGSNKQGERIGRTS